MPQTVWIARHGNRIDFVNPDWFLSAEHRYDPHLSEDGHVQAKQLANRLKGEGISHIFASPFLRTVQTANYAAEALDLSIKLEWGLCEWLNSDWMTEMPETESVEDLCRRFPRIDASYKGGIVSYPETGEACLKRAGDTAKRLAAEFSEDMLLVGHGSSVVGSAIGLAGPANTKINAALCCLVKVVRDRSEWSIALHGDTSHLTDSETVVRFN
ncbi:histidine phosphatase family protein [Microcoleus sp. bin38.metabat.b11b12b14.051]|uniref:histidine phosphatase family protein n=1 Tax=Microcoleus sp. bin38.metabat.b11b12b14.051 TaxID=2742709 RepID=UPI0025F84EF7|nr:histidine phosphatase family protein [Microcoleus sp. bin38.metabat.b11b12b14.051]